MNKIERKLNRHVDVFNSIANIAAINHYRGQHYYFTACKLTDAEILAEIKNINSTGHNSRGWTSYGCHTFRCPNTTPGGYWKVLNLIADVEGGLKRREICEKLNVKSLSLQLRCLEWAGLIRLDRKYTHKFSVTDFGKAYIAAVYAEFDV